MTVIEGASVRWRSRSGDSYGNCEVVLENVMIIYRPNQKHLSVHYGPETRCTKHFTDGHTEAVVSHEQHWLLKSKFCRSLKIRLSEMAGYVDAAEVIPYDKAWKPAPGPDYRYKVNWQKPPADCTGPGRKP